MVTTIQLDEETKEMLDKIKVYYRETYNELLQRLIEVYKSGADRVQLVETLEIISDPEAMREIAEALEAYEHGKGKNKHGRNSDDLIIKVPPLVINGKSPKKTSCSLTSPVDLLVNLALTLNDALWVKLFSLASNIGLRTRCSITYSGVSSLSIPTKTRPSQQILFARIPLSVSLDRLDFKKV